MKILKPLFLFGIFTLPIIGNAQWNRHRGKDNDDDDRTVYYKLERNDPTQSGLLGVSITPVYVDGHNLNFNIGGGAEFYYTFKSNFRLSGGYHFAYADNITNDGGDGEPVGDWDSYGAPAKSKKLTRYNLMASATLRSWQEVGSYHITLGKAGYNTVAVTRVRANVMKAITSRIGYEYDTRSIQAKDGIQFKTTTPDYNYYYNGNTYKLNHDKMSMGSTMMQSNIALIGIGYTIFRDIKIDLDDDEYTGRREERSQTDLFFDVMYAAKIQLQDMLYYHGLQTVTQESETLRQRLDVSATPLNKLGFRVGWQVLGMRRWFGTKVLLEGGIRPGPKGEGITSNMFGQLTVGLAFGGRIAQKKEKEEE